MAVTKGKAVSRREILFIANLGRQQRLLRAALQHEKVLQAFDKITDSRHRDQLFKRFSKWRYFLESDREQSKNIVVVNGSDGKVVLIQRVIRSYQARKTNRPVLEVTGPIDAAISIQRLYRGYMARGEALLRERSKLLRFLRSWSRGHAENLFHVSVLQEVEAQALIRTAISFTIIPSRPIRHLPSLPQIRAYRAGLFALYWQLHHRAAFHKAERKLERDQRRAMYYEDLCSSIREKRDAARIQTELQKQRDLEAYIQREKDEEERRKLFRVSLALLQMNNKQAIALREKREESWRAAESKKEKEKIDLQAVQLLYEREWELMTCEDGRSSQYSAVYIAELSKQLAVKQEAERVQIAKRQMWEKTDAIYRKGKPTKFTKAILLSKLRLHHDMLFNFWVDYIATLPLDKDYKDLLQHEILTDIKVRVLEDDLRNLLDTHHFSYKAIAQYFGMLQSSHENYGLKKRSMLDFFTFASKLHYHPWHQSLSVYSNTIENGTHMYGTVFQHITGVIKAMVLPVQSSSSTHDLASGGLQHMECVDLVCKLAYDANSLVLLEKVIQYQYLYKEYAQLYREISDLISRFCKELEVLQNIRNKVKEEKMLRSERQRHLTQAADIEKVLQQIRADLIKKCTTIYHSMYHIMKMCLELFCSKAVSDGDVDLPGAELLASLSKTSRQNKEKASGPRRNSLVVNSASIPQIKSVRTKTRRPSRMNVVLGGIKMTNRRVSKAQSLRSHIDERSYDIYAADHELYWQQLVYLVTMLSNSYNVNMLDMTSWPVPPIVKHQDDGTRHIVKEKRQKQNHLSTFTPGSSRRRYSTYAKSRNILAYISKKAPVVKTECKFFDIPGLNLFVFSDSQQYDFIPWSLDVLEWSRSCFRYIEKREVEWKADKSMHAYLLLQRLQYLASYHPSTSSTYHNTDPITVFHYQAPQTNEEGRNLLKQIEAASAAEVYELMLCYSQLLVDQVRGDDLADASSLDSGGLSSGVSRMQSGGVEVLSSILRADDLDRVCGKHPGSLYSYLFMISELAIEKTPAWPSIFSSSRLDVLHKHYNSLVTPLLEIDPQSKCVPSRVVLRVIDKELAELQELVKVLQDQNCLSLHPNTDNLYVNPENSTELVGIVNYAVVLMPQTLPVSVIENISTTNQWYFQFPTFMYPVLYLGRTAPKESFYKLYMREQTQGIMGEYTWYQNMDNKITQVAKRLICHLHKRQVIVSCFQANVSGLITLELQREQMIFEDSRSFLVQRYDLIQKRKQKKGVLLGCWDGVVGCLMPKRKHAKIYAMQQEDEECNKCIKSIQTFLNKKVRMTKITQIASQLRTQLKKFLRQLFSLNYDFYDKDIAEQIKNVEAFRYVDIPELCRKLSELNRQYLSSKFRRMSWTTGEKVFVNTEGNLIDPTQAVFPKLQGMSSVYHRMQIANTDQDTGCVEAMIGGGLESQYVVLRVLEDEQINARGVPIYEHFTPQIISRHMQDYFPNYRKLYEDNRDQIDYGVVLRTLFAYHPLCSCCRSAAASSWSSRDKLLCSKYACTHTNQVPMQPLPEQSKMVDRVFDLVVHIRYREAEMLNNGRGLIKLQAAMRGRLVRKRKNRSGNKRTYNK